MGKSQQRKGRSGELELVQILNDNGIPASPGAPMSCGATPDIVGVNGVHVECKRVEKLNLSVAMEQAIRDSERFKDGLPTVFHRRNRSPWLCTMRLTDWLELYKGWRE